MNLYYITKGQLITLWIAGMFMWTWAAFLGHTGPLAPFAFIIPAALIFYTIGWKNFRRGVGAGFYNATVGQILTLWVFSFFLWVWALVEAGNYYFGFYFEFAPIPMLFSIIIPATLIFYTLGWWNTRRSSSSL